jgi:sugar phosphate isomerase/epimerase
VKNALPYCAYVHVKDYAKLPDGSLKRVTVGEGDVDLVGCLRIIQESGFDGFVALEYEGEEDELTGVPTSMAVMKRALAQL